MDLTEEDVRILAFIAEKWVAQAENVAGVEVRSEFGRRVDLSRLVGLFLVEHGLAPDDEYAVTLEGVMRTSVWPRMCHAIEVAVAFMRRTLKVQPKKRNFDWPELIADVKVLEFGVLRQALPLFGFMVSMWSVNTLRWERGDDFEDVIECKSADELLALRARQKEERRPQRQLAEPVSRSIPEPSAAALGRGWAPEQQGETKMANTAFIIQGHDQEAIEQLELLLERIGLEVKRWNDAITDAGRGGSPHNRDVFAAGIAQASVVVALFTPDDVAQPRPTLEHAAPRWQPRPNVILETGWALGTDANKVVIVEIGMTHSMSDLDGTNTVRMPATADEAAVVALNNLAHRLEVAGASINRAKDPRWNVPSRYPALFRPVEVPPPNPQ